MCLVALAAGAILGCCQASLIKQVSPDAWKYADNFFASNHQEPVVPIVRRAFATYIEASRAYRKKDYSHCRETLDELWRDMPIGDTTWNKADVRGQRYYFGIPSCYPALVMLDEACRYRIRSVGRAPQANPIVMAVLLFGRSEGVQPRSMDQLLSNRGKQVTHILDPLVSEDNYARIRQVIWLFQEYVEAITDGKSRLDLDCYSFPDTTVHVETVVNKMGKQNQFLAIPNDKLLRAQIGALRPQLRRPPDWWWAITASHVPDEFPDFKSTEFISGGNNPGPDGISLKLDCDDRWLVRRPPFLGQGTFDPIEAEISLSHWFIHEFNHHVFGRFPEFKLETSGHIWFDRSKWPADFKGNFEPDYFQEAMHKRIQTAKPSLNIRLRYAPPAKELFTSLQLSNLLGAYRLEPVRNDWCEGELVISPESTDEHPFFLWRNKAGRSWRLDPDLASGQLRAGTDNPFEKLDRPDARYFTIVLKRDENGKFTGNIEGFTFLGELFRKL